MNDDELDRMVAAAAPIADGQVASLGLRDAEIELMEEIMATTTNDTDVGVAREPRPPWRRRVTYRVAAAAAVAVVVTAGVVSMLGPDDDDGGRSETGGGMTAVGTTDLPRLIPDEVPDGLHPITVAEYGQLNPLAKSAYYGHAVDGGLPVVDLTVAWANEDGPGEFGEPSHPDDGYACPDDECEAYDPVEPGEPSHPDLEPTPVRGHDGYACAGDACTVYGPGVQAGVEWWEHEDQPFRLTSPSLTVEQLVAVADGLVITGHDSPPEGPPPSFVVDLDEVDLGTLPDDLPVPLDELGRSDYEGPDPIVWQNGRWEPIPDLRDYVLIDYMSRDLMASLSVTVEPGQAFDLAGKLAATAAEPIADVRGRPAWAVTLPPGSGDVPPWDEEHRRIFWQEEPGVIVTIETSGTDVDEGVLRGVAESLQPATDAEWEDLLAESDDAAALVREE
jgi:hypothetical protein